MLNHILKDWTLKRFVDYLVVGLVLAIVISLVQMIIVPMVVKFIPGTIFAGTISLTDILLFFIVLLMVTRE